MLIKDILDMEEYLEKRCYCPNEIYSSDGFFYQLFYADSKCFIIGETNRFIAIITKPDRNEKAKPQIIVIYKTKDNKVRDTVRYDATENNITIIKKVSSGVSIETIKASGLEMNEYVEGSTAKTLSEIMSIADAVIIEN